ncbi:MAG: amino acid ABC transporter substrate-binding protein [Alphaproteobacteria bacterium]|jgi:general L-amino acid transport system substrate-binding protein|nr:amino acid ABC transporter substrate-binding protein [Rhodospirillaceae bacterium]MBT6206189.1 amino acid ABC transporter substrate-binding protein [Rhodospirillaceae bacterium]MBT6509771.1 amino acid ABC transporter substrate-binding protein [Rhodospirillaceae bacterium]MBT7645981.1 amino acid ABC transporter substrate-binding protein [Rhodospirillaceae bacterium]MDG2482405.1 amino acid ABC transporter substrate-binding protein [Alphaproteobacteria bacterium]
MKALKVLGMAVGAAMLASPAFAGSTLDEVMDRGAVRCGVSGSLAGFSIPDSKGVMQGLDADVCRAVAAAVLGDANAVEFVPLSAQQRFTALQSGEVDVLSRNTTWTLTRDTALGLNFTNVTFYDGQGFMVPTSLGVSTAAELDGAAICVQTGTTTEKNLTDYFRATGMSFDPVVFEGFEESVTAFVNGRCDVYTTDASGLASIRVSNVENPDDYMILPDIISKEPLGPVTRNDDDEWFDVVKWTVNALLNAEEMGISSANVDDMLSSDDPSIQRLLGVSPGMGEAMKINEEWAYNAIKQVGNYSEIFERHVGADTPLGFERGVNALWTDGGLMYAPPIR